MREQPSHAAEPGLRSPALAATIWITGFIIYYLGAVSFLVTVVPVSFILAPIGAQRWFISATARLALYWTFRIVPRIFRMYRAIETRPLHDPRRPTPCIYVATHRGKTDGLLLLGSLRNTGVLMKRTYARRPLFRVLSKLIDFVSVDSSAPASLARSAERCRQVLEGRRNLLFFPEGSRNSTSRLLPFRGFAFRLAVDTRLPIVPIVIYGNLPFLAKERQVLFPRREFTYWFSPMDPVYPREGESAEALADRVRREMGGELTRLIEVDRNTRGL